MGISVSGGNVAVPQPFLYFLNGDALGYQEAGAGVSEVMVPYRPHPDFYKQVLEAGRNHVWMDEAS